MAVLLDDHSQNHPSFPPAHPCQVGIPLQLLNPAPERFSQPAVVRFHGRHRPGGESGTASALTAGVAGASASRTAGGASEVSAGSVVSNGTICRSVSTACT